MDRTKIKDQFGQFGRRREYGADDDRTTSRQMKKSRRMCAAAAVLFAFAAAFVAEENYDYPVTAAVTTCWFPDKTYGDVTFPAGNYEALRIEIGSAKGHNWWCVLYPSLCFRDAANAVVPNEGKEKLKHVLTEEEYSEITAGTEFKISWYFWKKK